MIHTNALQATTESCVALTPGGQRMVASRSFAIQCFWLAFDRHIRTARSGDQQLR